MNVDNLLWTVAHLSHMMSKNEFTSGEKETIRRLQEPTVITTTSGKAESAEEATVYVND